MVVQDFLCVVYEVLEFIDQAIESGGRVFVHCRSVRLFVCKEGCGSACNMQHATIAGKERMA